MLSVLRTLQDYIAAEVNCLIRYETRYSGLSEWTPATKTEEGIYYYADGRLLPTPVDVKMMQPSDAKAEVDLLGLVILVENGRHPR